MTPEELKQRTKAFGIRAIKVATALPSGKVGEVVGKQLLRSATSVGAHYRSACRGRSRADFISKIGIEEADGSLYWLEVIDEAGLLPPARLIELTNEANELVAILTATSRTAKQNLRS